MNKLYFKCEGPTKDVSFNEYCDSKQLFNEMKNNRLKFDRALKGQKQLLKIINEVNIGKKNLLNKKKYLIILKSFKILEKKLLIFLKIMLK